jgi:hypothetical protein
VILSAQSCIGLEVAVRMEVLAGPIAVGTGLREGLTPNITDVIDALWWRQTPPMRKGPPNYRMQQTVRPVTSVAGQRPRRPVPQLTHRR